jgi:hypothetical protein
VSIPYSHYNMVRIYNQGVTYPFIGVKYESQYPEGDRLQIYYTGSSHGALYSDLQSIRVDGVPALGLSQKDPQIIQYIHAWLQNEWKDRGLFFELTNSSNCYPPLGPDEPTRTYSLAEDIVHNCVFHPLLPFAERLKTSRFELLRSWSDWVMWMHDNT